MRSTEYQRAVEFKPFSASSHTVRYGILGSVGSSVWMYVNSVSFGETQNELTEGGPGNWTRERAGPEIWERGRQVDRRHVVRVEIRQCSEVGGNLSSHNPK